VKGEKGRLRKQLRKQEALLVAAKKGGKPHEEIIRLRKDIMATVNQISHLQHIPKSVPIIMFYPEYAVRKIKNEPRRRRDHIT
jgi:hypothetical protein